MVVHLHHLVTALIALFFYPIKNCRHVKDALIYLLEIKPELDDPAQLRISFFFVFRPAELLISKDAPYQRL